MLKKIKPLVKTYFERADILLLVLCTILAIFSVFIASLSQTLLKCLWYTELPLSCRMRE